MKKTVSNHALFADFKATMPVNSNHIRLTDSRSWAQKLLQFPLLFAFLLEFYAIPNRNAGTWPLRYHVALRLPFTLIHFSAVFSAILEGRFRMQPWGCAFVCVRGLMMIKLPPLICLHQQGGSEPSSLLFFFLLLQFLPIIPSGREISGMELCQLWSWHVSLPGLQACLRSEKALHPSDPSLPWSTLKPLPAYTLCGLSNVGPQKFG